MDKNFLNEKIIKMYNSGISKKKIRKELKVSSFTVDMALIETKGRVKIPEKEICENIIYDYENNKTLEEIREKYSITNQKIKTVLHVYEIKEKRRKTLLNDNFFEKIDTEEKAYWLGFMFADGYNDEINGKIEFCLQYSDRNTVDEFNKAISSEYKCSIKENGKYKSYKLTIKSKKMSDDLSKLGCIQKKSLVLNYPKIDENLNSHFIRGYFDGDGSVSVNKDNNRYSFHILGTEDFLEEVRNKMSMQDVKKYKKGNIFDLNYGGKNNLIKIRNFLYKDANVYMKRKKEKFYLI